jgi:hypothetical protein
MKQHRMVIGLDEECMLRISPKRILEKGAGHASTAITLSYDTREWLVALEFMVYDPVAESQLN